MAKREISSTLKNLKFMQRAAQKEEKSKEVEEVIPNGNFSPSCMVKKCVVIMEGDPHPGVSKGRMSFQSFNPSVDRLNEEFSTPNKPEASAPHTVNQNGRFSLREEESTQDGYDNMELNRSNNFSSGDLKRKQPEVASEAQIRFKKIFQSGGQEEHKNNRKSKSHSKGQKLDWSVLRPPKKPKED